MKEKALISKRHAKNTTKTDTKRLTEDLYYRYQYEYI